jgi:hypothetical protein
MKTETLHKQCAKYLRSYRQLDALVRRTKLISTPSFLQVPFHRLSLDKYGAVFRLIEEV